MPYAIEFEAFPTLALAEQRLIEHALGEHRGRIRETAEALGIDRHALRRRLRKYKIAVKA